MTNERPRGIGRIVAVGLALMTTLACSDEVRTPVANSDLQAMEADYVAYGMVSFVTASGVREGRIQADTAFV